MNNSIGKYYLENSIIHKMDPRTKLLCTLFYLLTLFLIKDVYQFLFVTTYLIFIIVISKIPFSTIIAGLKPIVVLFFATLIFQSLTSSGEVLFSIGVFNVTQKGVYKAVHMGFRLILLVAGGSLLSYTTTATELTNALDKLFKPLEKYKIPIQDITFMGVIAIKFIPILIDETEKIKNAQIARGADFGGINIFKKGKSLICILVPVFLAAFQRANDLSQAMDSRCFQGGNNRSVMHSLKYTKTDYISYVFFFIYVSVLFLLG